MPLFLDGFQHIGGLGSNREPVELLGGMYSPACTRGDGCLGKRNHRLLDRSSEVVDQIGPGVARRFYGGFGNKSSRIDGCGQLQAFQGGYIGLDRRQ